MAFRWRCRFLWTWLSICCEVVVGVSLNIMAEKLREMAEKMAQAARAGVAIEKKRLQEILAERQKKSIS
jgi:ABC-type enterobactin transport system permease subunit